MDCSGVGAQLHAGIVGSVFLHMLRISGKDNRLNRDLFLNSLPNNMKHKVSTHLKEFASPLKVNRHACGM